VAAPSTAVHICNLALDRLGQRAPISATALTTPSGEIEAACDRHYDQVRRELLRKGIFGFARKYAILTKSGSVTPAYGYLSAYAIPSDCLRLTVVGNMVVGTNLRGRQFDIVEHHIYTSFDDDGNKLSVEYIKDATTVTQFDPLFVKCLVLALAKAISYKFTLKPSLLAQLDAELEREMGVAKAIAGQERPPRRVETSRLRDVRRFGFKSSDNTRYPF